MLFSAFPSHITLFVSVLTSLSVTCGQSSPHAAKFGLRHHGPDRGLFKRDEFANTKFTTYVAGPNACNKVDQGGDLVIAISAEQWDGGAHCFKPVTLHYNGVTAHAKVTDECMGCPFGAIDLSFGLAEIIMGSDFLDIGAVFGSWSFDDDTPLSASKTSTKVTSTTSRSSSSTSSIPTSTSSELVTTSSSTPTASTASASSSFRLLGTSTAASSSTSPESSQVAYQSGGVEQLNLAFVRLSDAVLFASSLTS
ncbi:uncharacterized protein BXZ73DRAFT_73239 [Epithele typhae]|uniref:uncharacterized protein n=1 Tax=Epithele typhae TaxID=378194 RepID=UPI002007F884|nr:uncharacterized protein BXZ73DRAFT_73239 [Epithele typhae]KAH9945009.1 hypothetical protein BXZ73DRAFT_73239 [Epithele typhae]